jgi:hypothetical protein
MSLRIGFDLDGVLADLESAYREHEERLFGARERADEVPDAPEAEGTEEDEEEDEKAGKEKEDEGAARLSAKDRKRRLKEARRRAAIIWHAIQATDDFWTTLKPLEEGVVKRLAEAAARHRWHVFFITQRPETSGDTAQRQTQRWLAAQGFDLPSVIVLSGSRGKLADALALDVLVDDTPKNCVDVMSDSHAKVVLVDRSGDAGVADNARKLGVAVFRTTGEALDALEQTTIARGNPTMFARLARKIGWSA